VGGGGGGGGALDCDFFYPASTFSDKLSAISIKDEGRCFPSDISGFSPIGLVGIFCLLSVMYKTCCESQKNPYATDDIFLSTEMYFSGGIICFRLLFLQWTHSTVLIIWLLSETTGIKLA
jgi:hypothetical protein